MKRITDKIHFHIESSLLTPLAFARKAVTRGATAVFVDPHEIANVRGRMGIRLFVGEALDAYLTNGKMDGVPRITSDHEVVSHELRGERPGIQAAPGRLEKNGLDP